MKDLVLFYLKRRFLGKLSIILAVVIFSGCGIMVHADKLINSKTEVFVYLDESCADIREQLMNRSGIYRDSKEDLDSFMVLYYENGWILTGQKEINEELRKQIEEDIKTVESDIYLKKADLVEKEFIERYRKSFSVRVEDSKKTDVGTLVISVVFYLVLTYSNLISNEIIYEKSTHMLDMIMCSVGEKAHFFSKIITAYLSLMIQGTWIALCGFFWLVIRFYEDHFRGIMDFARGYVDVEGVSLNGETVILVVLLVMVNLLLIQIMMMTVTCMFSDSEEAATFQNVYYVMLIGLYYLFIIKGDPVSDNTMILTVLSYVPVTSMAFMPIRALTGKAGNLDVLMVTVITVGILMVMVEILLPYYKKLLLRK